MIDPYTGKAYGKMTDAPPEIWDRLVTITAQDTEDIHHIRKAITHYDDTVLSDDKRRRRSANKRARAARKKNRSK